MVPPSKSDKNDLNETKRIMRRLVKTPPDPKRKAGASDSDQKEKRKGGRPAKPDDQG